MSCVHPTHPLEHVEVQVSGWSSSSPDSLWRFRKPCGPARLSDIYLVNNRKQGTMGHSPACALFIEASFRSVSCPNRRQGPVLCHHSGTRARAEPLISFCTALCSFLRLSSRRNCLRLDSGKSKATLFLQIFFLDFFSPNLKAKCGRTSPPTDKATVF